MRKYEEKISDNSIWVSATPTAAIRPLPFFVSEAGHFMADSDYLTSREMHDSFLLLYTLKGEGRCRQAKIAPLSHAVMLL